jgi:hypothetical protein
MTTQKSLQPRCFTRAKTNTPTPVTLSASGLLKPCNYYASSTHMRDLRVWANANGLDWENDLDVRNGIEKVYESETWLRLQKELESGDWNVPKTCIDACTQVHIQNDE